MKVQEIIGLECRPARMLKVHIARPKYALKTKHIKGKSVVTL